eukprot:g91.t1
MRVGEYDAIETNEHTGEPCNVRLRLHCGLACGRIHFYSLGSKDHKDALIGGKPLPQLAECETEAKCGQVVMASQFYELVREHEKFASEQHTRVTPSGKNIELMWNSDGTNMSNDGCMLYLLRTCKLVAPRVRTSEKVIPEKAKEEHKGSLGYASDLAMSRALMECTICADTIANQYAVAKADTKSIRSSPDGVSENAVLTRPAVHEMALNALDHNTVDFMGEMRQVTTIFVQLDDLIPFISSGNLEKVQSAYTLMRETLSEEGGLMRQFVQDDKGCVMIGAFGPQGYTYIDNEARALRFSFSIIQKFKSRMGIECSVGVATGDVYCGFVGAKHRSEWAMLGPSVNLAARLMGKAQKSQCLCEVRVSSLATLQTYEFWFRQLPAVNAKGYDSPVPVFLPHDAKKTPKPMRKTQSVMAPRIDRKKSIRNSGKNKQKLLESIMKKMNGLTEFESLVLKICAVVSFNIEDVHRRQHMLRGVDYELFDKWYYLKKTKNGGGVSSSAEQEESEVISTGVLSFILTTLGHSWRRHLHKALRNLQSEPALLDFAPFQKSFRKNSISGETKTSDSSMSKSSVRLLTKALKRHYLFSNMEPKRINHTVRKFQRVRVEVGKTVYRQGDTDDDKFYVIESGTVRVMRNTDGEEATATLRAGDTFGDLGLLYHCPRSSTMVIAKSVDGFATLWALDYDEFSKVKKNRYVFRYMSIRDIVYARILSGHRKTLHSLVASFLLDQRMQRQLLAAKLKRGVNMMKTALAFSRNKLRAQSKRFSSALSSRSISEESSVETLSKIANVTPTSTTATTDDETKDKCARIQPTRHGSKNYGIVLGKFGRSPPGSPIGLPKRKVPGRFSASTNVARLSVFSTLNTFQMRWRNAAERRKTRLKSLATSFISKFESQGGTKGVLSMDDADALAMSHVGGEDKLHSVALEVYSAQQRSEFATITDSEEGAKRSDDETSSSEDEDEWSDNELNAMTAEMMSSVGTNEFGEIKLRPSKLRESRLNESFRGDGGLAKRMCCHMLVSRLDSSVVIGQMQSVVNAIWKRCDHKKTAIWSNRIIGSMLNVDCVPFVVRHFVRVDVPAFQRDYRSMVAVGTNTVPLGAFEVTWQVKRITSDVLDSDELRTLSVVSKLRSRICDAANLRRRAMLSHRDSLAGRVIRRKKEGDGAATKSADNITIRDLPVSLKIAKFLRILASSYQGMGFTMLALNTVQVALMYLSLPTLNVRVSFEMGCNPFSVFGGGANSPRVRRKQLNDQSSIDIKRAISNLEKKGNESCDVTDFIMAGRCLYDMAKSLAENIDEGVSSDASFLYGVMSAIIRERT